MWEKPLRQLGTTQFNRDNLNFPPVWTYCLDVHIVGLFFRSDTSDRNITGLFRSTHNNNHCYK